MKSNQSISETTIEWMPKSIWGPLLWRQLHCRALAYLPMTGEKEWFECFIKNIPCPMCQTHFQKFVENNPPNFTSRVKFFEWTVSVHNNVNKSNGKEEYTLKEAFEFYKDMFFPDN